MFHPPARGGGPPANYEPEAEEDAQPFTERLAQKAQKAASATLVKVNEYAEHPENIIADGKRMRSRILAAEVPFSFMAVMYLAGACEKIADSDCAKAFEEKFLVPTRRSSTPAIQQVGVGGFAFGAVVSDVRVIVPPLAQAPTPADPANSAPRIRDFTVQELLETLQRLLVKIYFFLCTRTTAKQQKGMRLFAGIWLFLWLLRRRLQKTAAAAAGARGGTSTTTTTTPSSPRAPPPGVAPAALESAKSNRATRGGWFPFANAARNAATAPVAIGISRLIDEMKEGHVDRVEFQTGAAANTVIAHVLQPGRTGHESEVPTKTASPPGAGTAAKIYQAVLAPGSRDAFFKLVQQHVKSFSVSTPQPDSTLTKLRRGALQIAFPCIFLAVWYKLLKSLVDKKEDYEPSSKQHLVSKERRVRLDDIVLPTRVKNELKEVIDTLNHPERYRRHGVATTFRGVLLTGPSGTGKTMVARAVASEAEAAFVSCVGSELVEVYVGRGAARVRAIFAKCRKLCKMGGAPSSGRTGALTPAGIAETAAAFIGSSLSNRPNHGNSVSAPSPCVLFFDEIDAVGARTSATVRTHEETVQTVNQLLHELDGFGSCAGEDRVLVLGATNRYEALDSALLRPGRFDRQIFLRLPGARERFLILLKALRGKPVCLAQDYDFVAGKVRVVEEENVFEHLCSDGVMAEFSGADIAHVATEAVYMSLRREPKTYVRKKRLRGRAAGAVGWNGGKRESTSSATREGEGAEGTATGAARGCSTTTATGASAAGRSSAASSSVGGTGMRNTGAAANLDYLSPKFDFVWETLGPLPSDGNGGGTHQIFYPIEDEKAFLERGRSSLHFDGAGRVSTSPNKKSARGSASSVKSSAANRTSTRPPLHGAGRESPAGGSAMSTPKSALSEVQRDTAWEHSGRLSLGRPKDQARVSITAGGASPSRASSSEQTGIFEDGDRLRSFSGPPVSLTAVTDSAGGRPPPLPPSGGTAMRRSEDGHSAPGANSVHVTADHAQQSSDIHDGGNVDQEYDDAGSQEQGGGCIRGASSDADSEDEETGLSSNSSDDNLARAWVSRLLGRGALDTIARLSGNNDTRNTSTSVNVREPRIAILYCDIEGAVKRVGTQVRTRTESERWRSMPGMMSNPRIAEAVVA